MAFYESRLVTTNGEYFRIIKFEKQNKTSILNFKYQHTNFFEF